MQWSNIQNNFTKSLQNPNLNIPDAVGKTNGKESVKRFNVYRNNITVSLIEALKAGFPVTHELVGDAFLQ